MAQRFGRVQIMMAGILGMVAFSYPIFLNLSHYPTFAYILFSQFFLSTFAIAYAAPASAFLVSLFPVNQRYSGISIGYSLGHAIMGGFIPVLIPLLIQTIGLKTAPALCILISCFLGCSIILHEPFFFGSKEKRTAKLK